MLADLAEQLDRDGFAAPLRLFDVAECRPLLASLATSAPSPAVWHKGCAVTSRPWHDIATDPRIIDLVTPILGENMILWGASLLTRQPGANHATHTDVESCDPRGGFVSLWIGLDGTSRQSSLYFIRGSHRFGLTAQEAARRNAAESDEALLATARAIDSSAERIELDLADGEAALFDGRIWHGSHNVATAPRTALLLQYAAADRAVRMPARFDWPIILHEQWPPVIAVSGWASGWLNRLEPPPVPAASTAPNAGWELALPRATVPNFVSRLHFRGATPMIDELSCHSSVLAPGAAPHPPHTHAQEELLVIMSGDAELLTVARDGTADCTAVTAGDLAYYPAGQHHSLRNNSAAPVLYTMLRWTNPLPRWTLRDSMSIIKASAALTAGSATGHQVKVLLNRPSRWLRRLHVHSSVMPAGSGYDAHADAYDVAILLLGGSIASLGRRFDAPAVLFHPAGALHGLSSIGAEPARYIVFELESSPRRLRLTRLLRDASRAGRRGLARLYRGARRRLADRRHAATCG